ncbi:MAG: phenylacetate--CoA ligase family protein [Burkholderiaceae bacterium]
MDYASYFESVNIQDLSREFPIGDSFAKQFAGTSVDQLRQQQTRRLQQVLNRAAKIPFYQRLWGEAGVDHRDIKSVDDIARLPSFGKAEIMASIEAHPPFGDHHGRDIPVAGRIMPMLLHSTSGTTGRPQPLLFSPRTREVHKLMLARAYLMQGLGPADVVHSLYGHGPVNGGHYVREAVIHYTSAVFFPAGTGAETSSVKQIEFMREYGATVLVGFADYMLKLATVAREAGLEPGTDLPVRMISGHLSPDARDSLSQAWGGADLYDWYGVGDTGLIAAEGPDHDGMHVMEDAHCLELCDVETGAPITSPGMPGDMIVTCLFADDIFPIIRFNTHDVSEYLPGQSAMQLPFRRIRGFLGRSDNMVKLRGINVYPQAFASLLSAMPGFTGEYICVATAVNERDTLTIKVEINQPATDTLKTLYQQALKSKLGVEILVELVAPDSLASLTGVASRQKPIRLIDER